LCSHLHGRPLGACIKNEIDMELDYIDNLNTHGDNVVRLYNFDKSEAIKFRELIQQIIIQNKCRLDLSKVEFIERRNCNLILGLFTDDEGILSPDNENFFCILTLESYENMLKLIEPFCKKESKAHQYLYDVDSQTDFLFAPAGTW
jgi:hypothetical protein